MLTTVKSASCPITQEVHCKCLVEPPMTTTDQHDVKTVMRKLFTDHSVWTSLVLKSIVDKDRDTAIVLARLLDNQKDIGDQLALYIGREKGTRVTELFTVHIQLAGAMITAASTMLDANNSMDGFIQKVTTLYMNGDEIATFLSSLNEEKLPLSVTTEMFQTHNRFLIDMTKARIDDEFKREQELYDAYYNQMLALSDALSAAVEK